MAQSVTPLGSGRAAPAPVVYVGDELTNDVDELYAVAPDGSAPAVRLNDALVAGGDVGMRFWPVSRGRVVFLADASTDELFELFVAPLDGSAAQVRISGDLVSGGDVIQVEVAGERVVYLADAVVDGQNELYSVPVAGGQPPVPLAPGVRVDGILAVTPDGGLALFSTYFLDRYRLWVVPTDASAAPLLLADSGTPSSAIGFTYFFRAELTPDETRAVLVTVDEDFDLATFQLHGVPIDGSAPAVRLDSLPGTFGTNFLITPDGSRVLFSGGPLPGQRLYSIHPDGTDLVDLGGGARVGTDFCVSPDGQFAAYVSQAGATTGPFTIFLVQTDGSVPIPVIGPTDDRLSLVDFAPTGLRLVYVSIDGAGRTRLHSVSSLQAPLSLIGDPPPNQGVLYNIYTIDPIRAGPIVLTRDGQHAVFRADLDTDELRELYSVRLDGSEPPRKLNPPLAAGRTISSFRLSADGGRVVFRGNPVVATHFGLYGVPITGALPAVLLSGGSVPGRQVRSYLPVMRAAGHPIAPGP